MATIKEVIDNMSGLISLKPATHESISAVENELKLSLSEEYKIYLENYGAILAEGVELTGIAKSEHRNVIQVTIMNWELNKQVPKNMYAIEDTHVDGIVIWQDSTGVIYRTSPNKEPEKIFDSLSDYLLSKK